MDLGKGPRQPNMVVKKENERAGKLSRTKYFIRIGESNMMPEIKEPVNLPDGGFIVPMQVDVGSSDFMRPQMPSPGDIRRMFGSDKIDCEPEYARGMDPDWSRVSPTTPEELENKVREWNAATNATLRKYRDIEEKRRHFDKRIKQSKVFKRTRSEGDKKKNLKMEQRLNSAGTRKYKKRHWRNWPRELESSARSNITTTTNSEVSSPREHPNTNFNQDILSNDGKTMRGESSRIPYSPQKIKFRSYNTAICVVQKMTSDHWIMIDKLYNDIKREQGINLDNLNKRVMKIVREIYGIESEFILSTIHHNPVKRVIKLGKLMLNVYHEAMFGSRKKQKLLVPGINNQHFAQKCLQAYTFTPQYRTTRMTSKMYERLTASREKPPKCVACYKKNIEKEKNFSKKMPCHSSKNSKQTRKVTNNRSIKKGPERINRMNTTKLSSPSGSSSSNGTRKNSQLQKSQMMLYIPPFLAKEQYEKSGHDLTMNPDLESNITFSSRGSQEDMTAPQEASLEKITEKNGEDHAVNSNKMNLGGGDSLVQFSNDYNYLLSSLYESSSNISLELSKKLSASPIMATFGGTSEKHDTERFFTSTANILQLNDQLEKMLLKEIRDESSRCFQEPSTDSDDEHYIDCDGVEDLDPNSLMTESQIKVQKKYYKYSKWMCITDDCISHRGYITFFMSVMLGLTTAIFCRDSFINRVKGDPTLKDSVKQVIKTFLMGALRLVDGF